MLIKICGIRDPDTALFAAQNGAHFIGMVLTPGFRRSVTVTQAEKIIEGARKGGAQPVAIFVGATAAEIESTCRQLGVTLVKAYKLKEELPSHLKQLIVVESDQPGSGKMLDPQTFSRPKQKPWFLAGGLNPQNIKEMIHRFQPDGVDVSSGVEHEFKKDHALILQFINEVKSCE